MDFQDIIFKLNRYWAKQGCGLMPLGGADRAVFARAGAGALWLAGAARRPAAGAGLPPGRYLYRVFLRPAPADARRLFLQTLKIAGVERAEHDLRWLPAAAAGACGWEVLLDGLPLASFSYLQAGPPAEPRPAGVEMTTSLERLALASQRKRDAAELAWAGRLTYGELHPAGGTEAA